MKTKLVLIVAYFGKLPNYFQLFLESCKYNPQCDWIIISDDDSEFIYPENVCLKKMTFEHCRKMIQERFDFPICLSTPQKLCDYKCAYGYIFSDLIKEYDWWGHCDLDQIFGNLEHFYTEELFQKYDKIGSMGHLTLYRNTEQNNKVFMSELNGRFRYKEVFMTEKGCAFDEWLPDNVNEIFIKSCGNLMLENMGADINPYKTMFQTVIFDIKKRQYVCSEIENSIFSWNNGILKQWYLNNGKLKCLEYPYIHLQKREIIDKRKCSDLQMYYIIPNFFVAGYNNTADLIRKAFRWKWFNFQYLKVKYNSFKYRLKNRDWKFTNVFRD